MSNPGQYRCPRCKRTCRQPDGCQDCLAERALDKPGCIFCGKRVAGWEQAHKSCATKARKAADRAM